MGVKVELIVEGSGFPHLRSSIVLITTPSRRLVVDCGARDQRDDLLDALARRQLDPRAIDGVLLTHLHSDHCQNVDLFSLATVYLHRREHEDIEELVGLSTQGEAEDYIERHYEIMHPVYRRMFVRSVLARDYHVLAQMKRVQAVAGTFELDEGVSMVESWGHTAGHMSIRCVDDHDHETWMVGDLVASLDEYRLADSVSPWICWNRGERARSLSRLSQTMGRIVPGHGPPFLLPELSAQWTRPGDPQTRPDQSIVAQRVVVQPIVPHLAIAQPAIAQPAIAQPAVAQPIVPRAVTAQPAIAQSVIAQPAVAQPVVGQPAGAQRF